jgi:zinc transport system substrate-binding protein
MKKTLLILLCLFGCTKKAPEEVKKPLILFSVEPYVFMCEEIAKDLVNAKCVLPSYVDPHNWEPKHRDLTGYENATLWFTIGEGFESPLLKKIKTVNPKLKVVSLAQNIDRITACASCNHAHSHEKNSSHSHQHPSYDTHFWLDPITDIRQAKLICDTLSSIIPEKATFFEDNYIVLKNKLQKIDKTFSKSLKPVQGKILATSHGAYTYFCHRYSIEQYVIEPSEGKEPRPKDLTNLVNTLKSKRDLILAIFTQPQHSNKAAKILAKTLSLPIYSVDPYKKNYIETMILLETYLTKAHEPTHH